MDGLSRVNIRKKLSVFMIPMALMCALTGCIFDNGDDCPVLRLQLKFPPEIMESFHEYPRGADGITRRCVVEVYPAGGGEMLLRRCLPLSVSSSGTASVDLDIGEGDYDLRLWSDYAAVRDLEAGLYYDADRFDEVVMKSSDDVDADVRYKDAAYATLSGIGHYGGVTAVAVRMERPVAAYRIVADDAADYVGLSGEYPDRYFPIEVLDIDVKYQYFIPSAFDVVNGTTAISRPLVTYRSGVDCGADGETVIARDMLFIDNEEMVVYLEIGVIEPDGGEISRTFGLPVTLRRGCETVVHYDFFLVGGLCLIIDPTWAGDYVINF